MKPILDEIFTNDTINRARFPIFQKLGRRMEWNGENFREITFFLNAYFDFKNKIWKSGIFEISKEDWVKSDTNEYKYPILGKSMICENSMKSSVKIVFLDDRLMFYYNAVLLKSSEVDSGLESVGISFLSSNNPDYFVNKRAYVICQNDFGYKLVRVYVSIYSFDS